MTEWEIEYGVICRPKPTADESREGMDYGVIQAWSDTPGRALAKAFTIARETCDRERRFAGGYADLQEALTGAQRPE